MVLNTVARPRGIHTRFPILLFRGTLTLIFPKIGPTRGTLTRVQARVNSIRVSEKRPKGVATRDCGRRSGSEALMVLLAQVEFAHRVGEYLQRSLVFHYVSQRSHRISLQEITPAAESFDAARDVLGIDAVSLQ